MLNFADNMFVDKKEMWLCLNNILFSENHTKHDSGNY